MIKKILFISDIHAPYHDKRAWKLVMRVGAAFKPHILIQMGDLIDNYSVSSHSKDPNRMLQLEYELKVAKKLLKEMQNLGAKENYFIEGNHSYRLERYLRDKAPELYNIISIPSLLQLDKYNFEYIPYRKYKEIGKLKITHDIGVAGRYAPYKVLDIAQKNIVIGHTHRIGYVIEGNSTGDRHVSASFGWLGDIKSIDYMNRIKIIKDWSLGFGIGYFDVTTNNIFLVPIPIINYSCILEGKLFRG